MDSPCASLDNESEEVFKTENVAYIPYGDGREASTSEEEATTYNAEMEREAEIDQFYRRTIEVRAKIHGAISILLTSKFSWKHIGKS